MHARERPRGRALSRWGTVVARYPERILVAWLIFVVAGFALALGATGNESVFSRLDSGPITVAGPNEDGAALIAEGGGSEFSTYTIVLGGVDVTSAEVATAGARAAERIADVPTVKSVANPFTLPGGVASPAAAPYLQGGTPAAGGFATLVTFDADNTAAEEDAATELVDEIADDLAAQVGATSDDRGGTRTLVNTIVEQVRIDGERGEGFALPVSFVVMLFVFGGFVAAGLPVLGAVASISGALITLLGFTYLFDLDASVVNVVTVLGLGLCIDYGLLFVSRFREELRHLDPDASRAAASTPAMHAALVTAVDRSGRTIVFSGVTVTISLVGMLVFDVELIRSVALGGISVVIIAMAVGISLIPALCMVAGRRVLSRGREAGGDEGTFSALASAVQARPWLVIVAVTAVLVAATMPVRDLAVTSSGAELLPVSAPARVFTEDLQEHYPLLSPPGVSVVARELPVKELAEWAEAEGSDERVRMVGPARELTNGASVVGFYTAGSSTSPEATALTEDLRASPLPFEGYVVSQPGSVLDFTDTVRASAGWAIAIVLLATLVLLFLMTGSLVIPVKALAMNVLSLGATLGAVVWIFQEGHLAGVLRFDSVGAIESTVPILVLALGFGLSMDYEVFLLSRVVELHERGHDTASSIRLGLQRSGRIITSAAALMAIVFAGFGGAQLLIMKEIGIALVIAVVIDATLIRMLLVPATMSVLGNRNWWAPAALRGLHERWGITE